MTAKPKPPRTCPECRYDGGIHYRENASGDIEGYRCPAYLAADTLIAAQKLTAEAHAAQTEAAKALITDAAAAMPVFSQNNIRDQFEHAGIVDKAVIGAAYSALSNCKPPLIEATGQRVQSAEDTTRSTICVWRSLHPRWAGLEESA